MKIKPGGQKWPRYLFIQNFHDYICCYYCNYINFIIMYATCLCVGKLSELISRAKDQIVTQNQLNRTNKLEVSTCSAKPAIPVKILSQIHEPFRNNTRNRKPLLSVSTNQIVVGFIQIIIIISMVGSWTGAVIQAVNNSNVCLKVAGCTQFQCLAHFHFSMPLSNLFMSCQCHVMCQCDIGIHFFYETMACN